MQPCRQHLLLNKLLICIIRYIYANFAQIFRFYSQNNNYYMKKFYAMALCAIVCASSAEAAPNRFTIKRDAKKSATKTLIASRSDASKI